MLPHRYPPELDVPLTWRQIYRNGAFGQRELISEGQVARQATDRSIRLGIGRKPFEDFDKVGALKPIAFAREGYWIGVRLPSADEEQLVFREEVDYAPWEDAYAWEADGFPEVTPLYSPWQGLYADDLAEGGGTNVPLDTLVLESEERERALASVTDWYRSAEAAYAELDEAWRPLVKLLVVLQNRFWPEVTGRVALLPDLKGDADWIEAGRGELAPASELLDYLACTSDQVLGAYHFLVDRGMDREPTDGLMMLRRSRHRAFHVRWRGLARRAQDNFDAAEMLRLFLHELLGENPPAPEYEVMDGRQGERRWLYEHGPAARVYDEKLKEILVETQLYPHGIEVIGEGPSEQRVVDVLVGELLHPAALGRLSYFDLEGVGAAKHLQPLARGFGRYAERAVVIVDAEGEMGRYANQLVADGDMGAEDLCLATVNLEEDNSTPMELLELAAQLAANPRAEGIEPVELQLTEEELLAFHEAARAGARHGQGPALADSLVRLALRHDPPVRIDKPDLAEALAYRMVAEFEPHARDKAALSKLYERRPVLGFVIRRVLPVLNRPLPIS